MTREPGRAAEPSVEDLVPAGTPIDLDNCAREPIHIPGSIQPRGVLAVVDEHDFTVRHVSANVAELLDRPVDAVLTWRPGEHPEEMILNLALSIYDLWPHVLKAHYPKHRFQRKISEKQN